MRIQRVFVTAAAILAAFLAVSCANQGDPEVEPLVDDGTPPPAETAGDPEDEITTPEPVDDDGLRLPDTFLGLPSERDLRRGPAGAPQGGTPGGVRSRPPTEPPPRPATPDG